MIGNSQDKPVGRFNFGPPTEPQVRQLYHGMVTEPVFVYSSNPVSWNVLAGRAVPYIHIQTKNAGKAVESLLLRQLEQVAIANAPRGGGHDKSGGQR